MRYITTQVRHLWYGIRNVFIYKLYWTCLLVLFVHYINTHQTICTGIFHSFRSISISFHPSHTYICNKKALDIRTHNTIFDMSECHILHITTKHTKTHQKSFHFYLKFQFFLIVCIFSTGFEFISSVSQMLTRKNKCWKIASVSNRQ